MPHETPPASHALELICMGRAAVDLYGEQIGGRLEDVQSFAKYLGGSPANTAVGASRLGLKAAMLTRVGDEHNGRFVRESLAAEGVDVSQVRTDPKRLTALVFLGIRDRDTFPLVFYREQCADMGLSAADVDPAFVASAKTLLISGTHLSNPLTFDACLSAMQAARAAGTRVALDIDYRPVLWGLTAPGLGEQRYVANDAVSAHLQKVLPLCDLIVGTEEEVHIAGGSGDSLAALRRIREVSPALIVMKRGPMGCVAYPGPIPARIDGGVTGPGFPVEVFNVLGAGDAFMAGLLRGWVRDEPLDRTLSYANACGAIVVSRHGCAPAMASWDELNHFLRHGSPTRRLREDALLEHLHRASTRSRHWGTLAVLAFDHRAQLEELAARHGVNTSRIAAFKQLVAQAARQGYDAAHREAAQPASFPTPGVIIDGRYGEDVLPQLTGEGWWVARPVERPGSRPLRFEEGPNVGLSLRTWPGEHVVKCLVSFHPDDSEALRDEQLRSVAILADACNRTGHELLVEVIPPREMPAGHDTLARAMRQIYAAGVWPDWWKLPPPLAPEAWQHLNAAIAENDLHCRGVLLLGLEASEDHLAQGFRAAAGQPLCKGFAVGRSLFADAAGAWFAGTLDDAGVVEQVATNYKRLIQLWCEAQDPVLSSRSKT
ncbi:MAG TPA: 5-dehydro-2-deoxygluconokinase [Rhizobacter sp.]|nr:5-dehydro-2-deoxygluconokinase [Rhizobacter sp.]